MPAPHTSTQFGDLLDPRFQKIFWNQYKELSDMIGTLYADAGNNGRNNMQWSSVGALGDWDEFAGSVSYGSMSQGYDTTATPIEFTKGVQVERKLFDDDQYNIMDQRPRGMAMAAQRTRQRHAARIFNLAFSNDTYFYNNSEGVALCSNSHTNTSGASTSSGYDNLSTSALTATAVAAARIQMVGFRGDQAEMISVNPNELWYPPNLYEVAEEIIGSQGKVDTANNNKNVHYQGYKGYEWNYMTDTNNWFMCDSAMRKAALFWWDRIPVEFGFIEDFDTLVAKWRGYMRYAMAWVDWRWAMGHQVS